MGAVCFLGEVKFGHDALSPLGEPEVIAGGRKTIEKMTPDSRPLVCLLMREKAVQ